MSTQNVIVNLSVSHQDLQMVRNTMEDALSYKPMIEDPKPANLMELQSINSLPATVLPHQTPPEGVIRCINDLSDYDHVDNSEDLKTEREPHALGPQHCWHDCHSFDGPTIRLPIKYNGETFTTEGQFCSYACAKAWARNERRHTNKYEGLISMMYRRHLVNTRGENGNVFLVPTAPPRSALKAFGGTMTITEFRQKSDQGEQFESLPPNQIPVNSLYAENEFSKIKRLKIRMANQEIPAPKQQTDVLNMLDKWT
jgi:hypothetical protein